MSRSLSVGLSLITMLVFFLFFCLVASSPQRTGAGSGRTTEDVGFTLWP